MKYALDLHTHTLASGHAYNTILEMAKAASKLNLDILGITEHARSMPGTCSDFYFSNLKTVERRLFGVEILLGVELNLIDYDGKVDMESHILKDMDIAIASFHTPCIRPGTMEENTNSLVQACKNPYINVLGHPDDSTYPLHYETVIKAARDTQTLIEINNSSISPQGFRKNAAANDVTILNLCRHYNVPVVIGSDAHFMTKVGNHQYAAKILDETGFPKELVYNYFPDLVRPFLNKYKHGNLAGFNHGEEGGCE